ncbi:MAG: leucine--tRNA ligase [Bacteroidota bacterium]
MMEYNFSIIEKKWQQYWKENQTYRADTDSSKEKYYVLDMFPYPSGAGLHVGHPLGYIASDIFARYKRLMGYNVLHPMGYDSFGLPAEQYAIQTGQHPAITTEENIARYRQQLDNIGFAFDWSREVRTSDPSYYKWTQWIFIQLFNSWYNTAKDKAEDIASLISTFESSGNKDVQAVHSHEWLFTAADWKSFDEKTKAEILLNYRLAYISEAMVNWCPALGTVLANDEVKDGVSERGGYPVERKQMKQWSMRITAYAQRLLDGLEKIDWPDSLREQQRNWIGRSEGAEVRFKIAHSDLELLIFTTRPDTIFGATYMTLAPEHEYVDIITTNDYKNEVNSYVIEAKNRSERERMAEVKNITGVFTGAYAIHPFSGKHIPIWIGDYVLAGYGTGAVMAVPAHDSRDYAFAKHFKLPIEEVVSGGDISNESYDAKEGKLINSDFLNGLDVKEAIKKAISEIESKGIGKGKINFRLRDAVFGRQRYWGEPIPIYYKDGIAIAVDEKDLPVVLPEVDKYLPTEDGEPPLARAKDWSYKGHPLETTTMPGWAGSSWYFLRYMDANNDKEFASKKALDYWKDVDLYLGGAEHATGHLLYVRFWTKFLCDRGYISIDEPAKKLINQGMIQGRSNFVYRLKDSNKFVSFGLKEQYEYTQLHVDVNIVEGDVLDVEAFKAWREENKSAEFILEDGKYICGNEVEKMSKSKWNVVSPDLMIDKYGADCLRLYEMFLGPLELSKPWNTNGITGTSGFIRKLWKLYHKTPEPGKDLVFEVTDAEPTKAEYKALHKTIKKVKEDIEKFSFNTSVSTFMICVNELTDLKCNKRKILEPLTVIVSPYAPHIAEELWQLLGNKESVTKTSFPEFKEEYLVESEFAYPISLNGKTKFNLALSLSLTKEEIEKEVLANADVQKLLNGQPLKKLIVVPGKIVNVVV